ncbi:MAG: 3-deoxy-D-manno-octulosonic acid transferase [Armatimonadota bacterium]|nr:MAG: 3-deoxy-D-manno-octulosonic acid transferase [Armatimonadota bacterium]
MFWLYNLALPLLAPLWLPWMLWRASRRQGGPNWRERLGNYRLRPNPDRPRVWLHAVSVGEVVAARPILKELRAAWPQAEVVLSVTTSSGHQIAESLVPELADHLVYFPIDLLRFQVRAMSSARPSVVAVMETELWMNFFWAAKAFGARTLVVNGRISDRSFRRARRVRGFYRALLRFVDRCLMQTEGDAERIRALGAVQVEVQGNSKFDEGGQAASEDEERWRTELGLSRDKPVVVVGSTRDSAEESLVVEAIRLVGPERVRVVHAPRHLESAPALVESVTRALGGVALRSKGETGDYLILDTFGELAGVYSTADVVVVGGGFSNLGGQNILQPLAHGKPVLHGPHMANFRDVAQGAAECGATRVCADAESLAAAIDQLLADERLRERMGQAARDYVATNLGAAKRYAEAIRFEGEAREKPSAGV